MKMRIVAFLFALIANSAFAAVLVTPQSPSSSDPVKIRVENTFGAEAHATSASIIRTGNNFLIQQNVAIGCTLPSNPVVASEFELGALSPGDYTVTANISFTDMSPVPPCGRPPISQTAAFTVTPAAAIPALNGGGLILLAAFLGISALAAVKC
jgi:hypothetical protein